MLESVLDMIEPIKTLQIDIFDKKQSSEWKALKSKFFTQNEGIKVATKDLIDMLFRYVVKINISHIEIV